MKKRTWRRQREPRPDGAPTPSPLAMVVMVSVVMMPVVVMPVVMMAVMVMMAVVVMVAVVVMMPVVVMSVVVVVLHLQNQTFLSRWRQRGDRRRGYRREEGDRGERSNANGQFLHHHLSTPCDKSSLIFPHEGWTETRQA